MNWLDLLFGCSHKRYSFPLTIRGKRGGSQAASATGTYVVCLDCGQEFPYDWEEMKLVHAKAETPNSGETIAVLSGHRAA